MIAGGVRLPFPAERRPARAKSHRPRTTSSFPMANERVVFAIRGLDCASCAIDVGRALRKMPGVLEVNINYVIDKGYVEFDSDRITWDAVAEALENRGFRAVRTR